MKCKDCINYKECKFFAKDKPHPYGCFRFEKKSCKDCKYYNLCINSRSLIDPNTCSFYNKVDVDDNFYIN